MNIAEEKNEFVSLLKDKEYRDAFVAASINIGVPAQIRVLRKQRKWSQGKLADEAKMLQPAISRLEDPDRGSVNLTTLLMLAAAFNVGLMVKFVPFSEMVDRKLKLSLKSLEVPSFDEEDFFEEKDEDTDTTVDQKQFSDLPQQGVTDNLISIDFGNRENPLLQQTVVPPDMGDADSIAFNL